MITWLIENNPISRVDKKDVNGYTALHYAVDGQGLDAIRVLASWGADVNNLSDEPLRQTPLHIAVQANFVEGAELLIHFGACTKLKDGNGDTPIDILLKKYKTILNENRTQTIY
jgi:ankyrin repeat protein